MARRGVAGRIGGSKLHVGQVELDCQRRVLALDVQDQDHAIAERHESTRVASGHPAHRRDAGLVQDALPWKKAQGREAPLVRPPLLPVSIVGPNNRPDPSPKPPPPPPPPPSSGPSPRPSPWPTPSPGPVLHPCPFSPRTYRFVEAHVAAAERVVQDDLAVGHAH